MILSLVAPTILTIDPRFSQVLPGFQIRINSSSLGPFKTCPRKYQYLVVERLERIKRSVHLTFGTLVHKGVELFDLGKLEGLGFEENVVRVVDWALRATWDFKLNRPWQSEDGKKNRESLIRTLVWYMDQYGEEEALQTVILPNGKPAIELNFEFDSGYRSKTGEAVTFIGKLDKIVEFAGGFYVKDIKTTGHEVGPRFFVGFSPGNQFSLYSIAARIAFGFETKGIICDGVQVGTGFCRFYRAPVSRPDDVLEDWLKESHWWIGQMEDCAERGVWPQNDTACDLYGGCEFRGVCSARGAQRVGMLKMGWRERGEYGEYGITEEDLI